MAKTNKQIGKLLAKETAEIVEMYFKDNGVELNPEQISFVHLGFVSALKQLDKSPEEIEEIMAETKTEMVEEDKRIRKARKGKEE